MIRDKNRKLNLSENQGKIQAFERLANLVANILQQVLLFVLHTIKEDIFSQIGSKNKTVNSQAGILTKV